jgi:hypothetical protein
VLVPLSLLIASVVLWVLAVLAVMAVCASARGIDRQLAREKQRTRAIL